MNQFQFRQQLGSQKGNYEQVQDRNSHRKSSKSQKSKFNPINHAKHQKPYQQQYQQHQTYNKQPFSSSPSQLTLKTFSSSKPSRQSQNQSKISLNQENLLSRLLQLQIDLVSKINRMKQQKISLLQQYNSEYDKWMQLDGQIRRKTQQNQERMSFNRQQQYLTIENDFNPIISSNKKFNYNDNNKNNEHKLKTILAQTYQLIKKNDYKQSMLNKEQLQQLDQLIKFNKYTAPSMRKMKTDGSCGIMFKDQQVGLEKFLQDNYLEKRQSDDLLKVQCSTAQQILLIEDYIDLMRKKIYEMETQRRIKSQYQRQSFDKVSFLMRKKTFLEKEIQRFDQQLILMEKEYQLHKTEQQNKIQQSRLSNNRQRDSFRSHKDGAIQNQKYSNIKLYFQLKQKHNILLKQNQKTQHSSLHINQKHQILIDLSSVRRRSSNPLVQQLNKMGEQQKINQLSSQIQEYENYIRNQEQSKLELYEEIGKKNQEYNQIKRQNKIIQRVLEEFQVKETEL